MDFDTVPDERLWDYVRVQRGPLIATDMDDFNTVHARGLARTTTALRAWWDGFEAIAVTPAQRRSQLSDRIITRLLSERLRYLEEAESRRRVWIARNGGALR